MNKLNTTIILSLILMLSGCAANTDEAPSATTVATTTTTVATTTTAAATTQATTTSAQTTAVTEQSEPAETTVVTDQQDLAAADTLVDSDTVPKYVDVGNYVEPEQTEQAEPMKPEENTTPDGQYSLADSDLVNPDGTYSQDFNDPNFVIPDCIDPSRVDTEFWASSDRTPNPSQIPYSQITLENAHLAFPDYGWIGDSSALNGDPLNGYIPQGCNCADPGYVPIYETDSDKEKTDKLRWNLIGSDNGYDHEVYETLYDMSQDPHLYFASEADWLARKARF